MGPECLHHLHLLLGRQLGKHRCMLQLYRNLIVGQTLELRAGQGMRRIDPQSAADGNRRILIVPGQYPHIHM